MSQLIKHAIIPLFLFISTFQCFAQETHKVKVAVSQGDSCIPILGLEQTSDLFSVYPVPATGYLTIESPELIKEILIHSLSGKLLQHHLINTNQTTIDIGGIQNGIYILQMKTSSQSYNRKILLNNK